MVAYWHQWLGMCQWSCLPSFKTNYEIISVNPSNGSKCSQWNYTPLIYCACAYVCVHIGLTPALTAWICRHTRASPCYMKRCSQLWRRPAPLAWSNTATHRLPPQQACFSTPLESLRDTSKPPALIFSPSALVLSLPSIYGLGYFTFAKGKKNCLYQIHALKKTPPLRTGMISCGLD